MTTAGDGKAPYESGGAGGKFRKRPFRRNVPAKPYDRPPIPLRSNNPSLLRKLVDPASRLIYAGAHRLFGAFRKRLPSLSLQGPPEVNVESQNVLQETGQIGNSANISAATGISELEQMLQQKSFTSSEIQRLTALLHSRTTGSPSDVVERYEAKPYNSASTSGSQKKHENDKDNRMVSFSTPIVSSKVFEEDIASPAELAKAYMGYRPTPTKLSPSPLRQDYKPINNTMGPPKTPITSTGPKTADSFTGKVNGLVTPRSRGRSAMYNMARTPYARSPSTFTQKLIGSSYGHDAALTSSQSGFGHDKKTALKRRSSVLDDDIVSGGPLRRTRQKANLLSQRERRELGYPLQQPEAANQKLLLTNGPETNVLKRAEENGETSIHGSGSGYASIPTKSTQTATKILQHLEQLSPKEKESNKLTSLEKVDSPKLLNYPRDIQKPDVISKGKEKIEENGFEKFPSPRNMLTSVNGESSVTVRHNPPIVKITDPPSKVQAEPPQKKRAFQMSVADDSFEIDDDEIYVNTKPETALLTNTPVADIIKVPKVPEVSGTPALVENDKPVFPEVVKSPKQPPELKEADNTKSFLKTDGGSVGDQGLGFKLPNSSSPTIIIQTNVIPQSNLQTENVDLKRDSSSFSVGKIGENVSPFSFSANEIKPNTGPDPKAVESTSVFTKSDHAKDSVFNKNENKDDQKTTNVFGKSPAATSASGSFMFGTPRNNSTTSNVTPITTAPAFPSFTSFPASTAATTSTTAASSVFSTSVQPPPVFSFGSANSTSAITTTSVTENGKIDSTNEKELKSTITTSPFANTSFDTTTTTTAATTSTTTGSSLFGFPAANSTTTAATATGSGFFALSSPAATSTTTAATGSNPFGFSSTAAASTTTAATGSSPFGFSSPAATSTTTAASGSSPFGFSSPAATSTTTAATGSSPFGFSSPAATSTTTAATGSSPFGFSSSAATSTTTAATGSSPFGFSSPAATSTTTAATGSSPFGFSSPAATSTTTAATGSSPFGFSSPAATSTTTAATGSSPFGFSSPAATSTTTAATGSSPFGFSSPAATSTTTAATGSSPFGFSSPAATSTTTAATGGSPFGFSSPAATSTTTAATGSSPFGFRSPAATSTTTAATGSSPFGFSSPAATSTTTAATGSSPFGFSSPAATSTTTAATGSSPFGFSSPAATSTTTAATGSSPFGFSSPAATSTTTAATGSSHFGFSSPAATSTTTAATGSSPFGFSSPAATSTTTAATGSSPFGFSSPAATSTTTAATGSSPFGFSSPAATSTTTAATGSSPFGFSSPATTSTTSNNHSQGSFFNITNGSQATTTQTAPFQFGSTEGKSGTFTSGPTTSVFGSTWQAPQSSGFGSTFSSTPSSVFSFGASSTPTPSAGFFATAGATNSTFATPSQSQPIFGKSTPVFGAISPNNNDRMSIEDSMAEDSMQTPGPISPFGQTQTPVAAPGFMFGSANPAQTQPPVGFQFGGQSSQPPPQNPFQSSSVEFNGGGSFSLGSGGDKSGRRFVKVKKQTRRK